MSQLLTHNTKHQERVTLFANILLPVPVPRHYTYRVPYQWNSLIQIGQRVIVQFGPKKIITGVVLEVHEKPPGVEAKYILDILDEHPVVCNQQLALINWMASYYMCAEGQVLQVALPSGLKLSSQSRIQLHPSFDPAQSDYPLSDQEHLLIKVLSRDGPLNYAQAGEILNTKNLHKIIKSLLAKSAVLIFEEVKEKFQPKIEKRLRLTKAMNSKSALEQLFDQLQKKPKQTDVLLKYLQQVPLSQDIDLNQHGLARSELLSQNISPSSVQTLLKNGIFEEFEVIVSRLQTGKVQQALEIVLTPSQIRARDEILEAFQSKDTVLFHGITGSGKTEIYIDLIQKVLAQGSQVLYLLPEIALTTQIVSRLQKIFGNAMGVYHSRFSDNERVEVWRGILEGKYSFIVGVRSSVFLPFDNLGLIIVDEEHELSYKQYDPAPRYHARDVALVLARLHHAKSLLGTATPSIESYHHVQHQKYHLVTLDERFSKVSLPTYQLIDIRKEYLKKTMNGVFSPLMLKSIEDALAQKKQAIIFQNRRGYAPYLQCRTCGHTPQCPNCSVTLTYHLHYNQLQCHYCGHKEKKPSSCTGCGSTDQDLIGFGTEKLEEDIRDIFPQARVQRMDLDTTRRKYSYQQIIDQFEKGAIDILIGTQMVSKGLDFDKVDLVGVLDIDRAIHFPDFRSHERTFQMITQVGGRAGRKTGEGQVLIQTKSAGHQLLELISSHNYQKFYQLEISERAKYKYPPFVRLIRLTVKSPELDLSYKAIQELTLKLVEGLGKSRVLGPKEPAISKLRNLYLMELYIKIEKSGTILDQVKQNVAMEIQKLVTQPKYRAVRVVPDVDPY